MTRDTNDKTNAVKSLSGRRVISRGMNFTMRQTAEADRLKIFGQLPRANRARNSATGHCGTFIAPRVNTRG